MYTDSVLIRCQSCGAVNRLPTRRVVEHPRCGKCKRRLSIPQSPVEVTEATFQREVLSWKGFVLVVFWSQA